MAFGTGGQVTYCLGMLLETGLIMMADTRTNAGVDNFSSFKKLHALANTPDRQIYACSAGSLSMSQSVISLLAEGLPSSHDADLLRSVREASTMFRAAQLVGEAVQTVNETVGQSLKQIGIESSVSLLLGGRIKGGPLTLFQIYGAGNFIQSSREVPFLQIGETKYGRPILDRTLAPDSSLLEAVKIGCLSFDSSIQSNLGVAKPIDLVVIPEDRNHPTISRRINEDDEYFENLSKSWADALREATRKLPPPPWLEL